MIINEFVDNSEFLLVVRSAFYYYDGRWNFPYGDDIGFYMIEENTNKKLDDKIKDKILKMETYLNDNHISYDKIDVLFNEIWTKI